MPNYHISPESNRPNICRAGEPSGCRYAKNGVVPPHFTNKYEAKDYIQKQAASEFDSLTTLSKTSKKDSENSEKVNSNFETSVPSDSSNRIQIDNNAISEPQSVAFDILASRLDVAKQKIDKANNALANNGIDERFEIIVEPYEKIYKNSDNSLVKQDRVKLILNKPSISYNGYKFLALVEEIDGNMISYNMSGVDLNGWRPESMECEHCHQKRARNKVYLVSGPDGQTKVVGGQCIKKYTGLSPAGLSALQWDDLDDLRDESNDERFPSGTQEQQIYPKEEILSLAYVISKRDGGYRSNTYYDYGDSTVDKVKAALNPNRNNEDEKAWAQSVKKEAKRVNVEKLVEKINSELEGKDGDWPTNIRSLVNGRYSTGKSLGLMASSMAVINKYEKDSNKKPWTKGFLGKEGEKIQDIKAKVISTEEVENNFGWETTYSTKIVLQTEDGHRVLMNSAAKTLPDEGEEVVFNATIKRHNYYKDLDTTIVSRPKFIKIEHPSENVMESSEYSVDSEYKNIAKEFLLDKDREDNFIYQELDKDV